MASGIDEGTDGEGQPASGHRVIADQAVLDALPFAVFVSAPNGTIVQRNMAAADFWGEQLSIGATSRDFYSSLALCDTDGEPIQFAATALATALRSAQPVAGTDLFIARPDDGPRTVRVSVLPYAAPTSGGQPRGTIHTFVDRTGAPGAETGQEARSRFDAFFDDVIVPMHWLGADGTIVHANQAALDFLGYSRDEYVGHDISEFHTDPSSVATIRAELARGGRLDRVAATLAAHDGSSRRVLISSSPPSQSGAVRHNRCIIFDVTAERARQELSAIVESSEDAIVSKDLNGIIVSWNSGAERVFGYSAAEIIGRPVTTLIPEPQLGEEVMILDRIRRGLRVPHYETVRRRKDGRLIDVSLAVAPVKDQAGAIVGASKIARDISERRRVEHASHEAERRLQLALEAGRMGAFELDIGSGKVTWTSSLEEIHGIAVGSFGGTFDDFKKDVHPEDLDVVLSKIEAAIAGRHDLHLKYRIIRPDGEQRWLEVFGRLAMSPGGKPTQLTGVCMDVTERHESERQRNLLLAELSHRVRNTLATVISIARQTFADAGDARAVFDARIRSLAQVHNRLSEAGWAGVYLNEILSDELRPFRHGQNLQLKGPAVRLSPKSALLLGMAIHELATNAAKYGALASDTGVVIANWQIDTATGSLDLRWSEKGGAPVVPPQRSGFGRILLERALTADLGGEVELAFDPSGLRCHIIIPASALITDRTQTAA